MVSDVTFQTALNQQLNTSESSSALAEDFSQFLQLLTVQLQNQDPLNPMDTNEFTNQLVAFTGVEQQINTNQKLDSLVSLGLSSGFSTALDYIGKDISYISSEFSYNGTDSNLIRYDLQGDAIEAKINIRDASGDSIFSQNIPREAGPNSFTWDGSLDGGGFAPPGTYAVTIDALDPDGNPISSTTVVTGQVTGIESQNGALFAIVGDRAVSLSNILNASEPQDASPADETPPAEGTPEDEGGEEGTI